MEVSILLTPFYPLRIVTGFLLSIDKIVEFCHNDITHRGDEDVLADNVKKALLDAKVGDLFYSYQSIFLYGIHYYEAYYVTKITKCFVILENESNSNWSIKFNKKTERCHGIAPILQLPSRHIDQHNARVQAIRSIYRKTDALSKIKYKKLMNKEASYLQMINCALGDALTYIANLEQETE